MRSMKSTGAVRWYRYAGDVPSHQCTNASKQGRVMAVKVMVQRT